MSKRSNKQKIKWGGKLQFEKENLNTVINRSPCGKCQVDFF